MSKKVTGWVFVPADQPADPAPLNPEKAKWDAIELDYRAGVKSLRMMAGEYGVPESTIRKYAKKGEWTRDLSGKIRARADELVRNDSVRSSVRTETDAHDPAKKASERQVIEAAATAQADVILRHRTSIGKFQRTLDKLAAQLDAVSDFAPDLEQLGEMMLAPDKQGKDKLNEIYHAVIAFPGQVDGMKKLAETLKIMIALERQSFKLDTYTGDDKEDRLERMVGQIWGSNRGLPIKE